MNIYYIDYENVTSQGLKGIELLTESDEVNLLYSKKAETMKIDILSQLIASRAKINFIPVHVGTPNALDFQLITLLFLHYKEENKHYIISKDSGYDCCIKTAIENNAPNVFRFPNIESTCGRQEEKNRRGRRGSGSRQNRQAQEVSTEMQLQGTSGADSAPVPAITDITAAQTPPETFSEPAVAETVPAPELSVSVEEESPVVTGQESVSSETAQTTQAEAVSAEEPARKRSSRRRGRRKASATASETEVREEAQEENQNQQKAQGHQKVQNQPKAQSQPAYREESPKQPQRQQSLKEDGQKQNQRQPGPRPEAEKADKPVTILSVIRRRNDVQLDLNQIDMIRDALKTTSNKQQFYNYFAKKLGQKKGIELYHSIKSSYTDLINSNLI